MKTQRNPHERMAYIISSENDKLLQELNDDQLAGMALGRMPLVYDDEGARYASCTQEIAEMLRERYFDAVGNVVKRYIRKQT